MEMAIRGSKPQMLTALGVNDAEYERRFALISKEIDEYKGYINMEIFWGRKPGGVEI